MRTSKRKTPVAALRAMIGIKDVEMAEILACSPATIHSLESGRLKLSESMAVRISHETGVAVSWLLGGRARAIPVSRSGRPYTLGTFERNRAKEEHPADADVHTFTASRCNRAVEAILTAAERKGDIMLAVYKIEKALRTLVNEFVPSKEIAENADLNWGHNHWVNDGQARRQQRRRDQAYFKNELRRAQSFFAKRKRPA